MFIQTHNTIVRAIETALKDGPGTPNLSGNVSTTGMGEALAALIERG